MKKNHRKFLKKGYNNNKNKLFQIKQKILIVLKINNKYKTVKMLITMNNF